MPKSSVPQEPMGLWRNHLLAALGPPELERLRPSLQQVTLMLGQTLYEPGARLSHAYFPTTSIISLLYLMESGDSTEIAAVGNEGVLGVSLFMGGDTTPSYAVVTTAGNGIRLDVDALKDEFARGGPMQALMLRYAQALNTQMFQTAACNRHHSIEQQLCRWLLMTLDRLSGNDLVVTQELIANALGVRREGITAAAGNLQRDGVIRYRRGHIRVLERAGLESGACECYQLVRTELLRLLPGSDQARTSSA